MKLCSRAKDWGTVRMFGVLLLLIHAHIVSEFAMNKREWGLYALRFALLCVIFAFFLFG